MLKKLGFRYNKPGHIKKFRVLSDRDLRSAAIRQNLVARTLKNKDGSINKYMVKMYTRGRSAKDRVADTLNLSKFNRRILDKAEKRFEDIGGTIYPTPQGKAIAVNKKYWEHLSKEQRRNFLAHESFHANNKILGRSEFLAHLYGGAKSRSKFFSQEGIGGSAKAFAQTRPDRVILELGLPATATAITVKQIKKRKNKKK